MRKGRRGNLPRPSIVIKKTVYLTDENVLLGDLSAALEVSLCFAILGAEERSNREEVVGRTFAFAHDGDLEVFGYVDAIFGVDFGAPVGIVVDRVDDGFFESDLALNTKPFHESNIVKKTVKWGPFDSKSMIK